MTQFGEPRKSVALFDLDGTLVRGDTLLSFLVGFAKRQRRRWPIVTMPVYLGLYAARVISDRTAKECLLRSFLAGWPTEVINDYATWFSKRWLPCRLRPEVVDRLRWHQSEQHRVVLVSASPDVYVRTIATALAISEVVCTEIEVTNGVCTGVIVGDNCKGPAKLDAVCRHFGGQIPVCAYAYGDSASDLPLLTAVDNGYMWKRNGVKQQVVRAPSHFEKTI